MRRYPLAAAAAALALSLSALPALAQKSGGILKLQHFDSPASMSVLEESTRAALQPMMAVFNNLVLYRQDQEQNRLDGVVPDLATGWNWSEDGTELSFPLHQGVKWHDGKPFTAADVKCTWDLLMGIGADKLRVNPRKPWYDNVEAVTTHGDYEVTFKLKRPQPALLALLASGWSPIYPCHVPAREMRQKPVGTGPFKFVEFKPNEYIKLTRNQDYWKKGRPYLDGLEFAIFREIAPRNLAFFAGNYDVGSAYGVTPPTLKDFEAQAPQAVCKVTSVNVPRTMLVNPHKPPFDNPELRRAMTLAIDREAFSTIINGGISHVGATMLPPPNGVWGMPPEMLKTLPGYDPDVAKNRAEARAIMHKLGYGPDKPLVTKLSTRDIPSWRQPAVLLEFAAQGNLDRERSRRRRHHAMVSADDTAQATQSARCRSRPGSMTPTRCTTRTSTPARRATMPDTAIRSSISWSIGSRSKPTRKSASRSSGRSNANSPKPQSARCCSTPSGQAAGSPTSRA